MIKSIEIENYKNFKHLKMENFKLINFFTGQNDTGKTNLLEALYINTGLCDSAVQVSLPPEHVVLVSEFRKIKLNNDNLKTFFYQENTANPISIRTEFEHATIPLTIQYPTQTSYSKDINLNSDDIHMTNLISKTITKPQLQFFYNPSFSPMTMTYEFERQNLSLIHSDLDKIAQTYKENAMFIPVELSIVNSLHALENLRLASKEKELMEVLKCQTLYCMLVPGYILSSFPYLVTNSKKFGFVGGGGNSVIEALTTGVSVSLAAANLTKNINTNGWAKGSLIAGLTTMQTLKNKAFRVSIRGGFTDEIESGLHYTKMQEFLKALFELAQKLQIQIFATAHNKEFLLNAINTMPNNETGVFKDIALFEFEKESTFGFIRHSYSMLEKALYRVWRLEADARKNRLCGERIRQNLFNAFE